MTDSSTQQDSSASEVAGTEKEHLLAALQYLLLFVVGTAHSACSVAPAPLTHIWPLLLLLPLLRVPLPLGLAPHAETAGTRLLAPPSQQLCLRRCPRHQNDLADTKTKA